MLKFFYKKFLKMLSPKVRLCIEYTRILKKIPNLKKPSNLNEKILKRILFDKNNDFALFADKYRVRDYIKVTIGENYLVPLIAVYNNADDLWALKRWENIVIKPNHGAGMVEIIENIPTEKEKINIIQKAKNWLDIDFSKLGDEWHYSLIPPKIVIEEKITAKGEFLRDYKFHRFLQHDGSFRQILQIVTERSKTGFETVFFDVNNLNQILYSPFDYKLSLTDYEQQAIKKILKLNEQLCTSYGYIRLDWYITPSHIYFGEITFTPGAGRSKSFAGDFGIEMGKLWVI